MIPRLRALVRSRPVATGASVVLVHTGVLVSVASLMPQFDWAGVQLGAVGVNVATLVMSAALIRLLGVGASGCALLLRRPGQPVLLLPLTVIAVGSVVWDPAATTASWVATLALHLAVAANEEVTYRGLVLGVLASTGVRGAVVGSAILFGLSHLVNAVAFGQPMPVTVAQVISNVAFGLSYGAVRMGVDTLWPLVALHALDNTLLGLASPPPAWWFLGVACAHAGYGWVLLRRAPPDRQLR